MQSSKSLCPAVAGALLLAGCAAGPQPGESQPTPSALQQITDRLPGRYVSVLEADQPVQSLMIERRSSEPEALALKMTQGSPDSDDRRHYGLKLASGSIESRLDGEFALLDAAGQARRSCSMRFGLGRDGLVGKTNPRSCRFGDGPETVGLLKEIAFDGRRVVIGDRLVDPETGQSRGLDQVITFLPVATFSGWVGVREGEEWRIARDFELKPGHGAIEPLDAADMNLGIAIELNYYRMSRAQDAVLLRLTATDPETGELVAEAWSSPSARSIGLALPGLQVGLGRP